MDFQIKGEQTARTDDRSLCRTCSNAHIIEGARPSHILIRCISNWNQPIDTTSWHVTKCNEFVDAAQPQLDSLEKIAWRVKADPKNRKMGFQSPAEWKAAEKNDDFGM